MNEEQNSAENKSPLTETAVLRLKDSFNPPLTETAVLRLSESVSPPLTETAILRLKEDNEDSIQKDYGNASEYYSYRNSISESVAEQMNHKKKKSKTLEWLKFGIGFICIIAIIMLIIFKLSDIFKEDNDGGLSKRNAQIIGSWVTDTGFVYTFDEDMTVTMTNTKKQVKTYVFEIDSSGTLVIHTDDSDLSYDTYFNDDVLTLTHYYNGLPERIYLNRQ